MSALRDEIRAILREEIAALRNEVLPTTETVCIRSSADLNRFAEDLLIRFGSSDFAAQFSSGQITFALAATPAIETTQRVSSIVSSPAKPASVTIDKALVTERDITELSATASLVRLPMQSRLTPLAKDEARRKGIRIERIEE